MKNRYQEIVFEADQGITFEFLEIPEGKLIVKAIHYTKDASLYSDEYVNPPIPDGFKHICGDWDTGFVIKNCSNNNQFVWIPVGYLDSNGTLDGQHFSEKFGRRNYCKDDFSKKGFHEELTEELILQLGSIKKYGGFYISRYKISRDSHHLPQSINGAKPWTNIDFFTARKIASIVEYSDTVKSHLVYGAEYDSVLEWFIKSNSRSFVEIAKDSTDWGNYWNSIGSPKDMTNTGRKIQWSTNNICDFTGNTEEWTQESNDKQCRVARGGNFYTNGRDCPAAHREYRFAQISHYEAGFRVSLYIK